MTVAVAQSGYYLTIDGSTSEVLASMVAYGVTRVEGYFVDVATSKRYILARK
jgi:hypothetical protein